MTTINDIAKKLGVAKSTVSNVFSKKRYVSAELTKKVLEVCDEMNFYPSFSASTLVTKKTNIIAIAFEFEKEYQSFYNDFIRACVEEASKSGISVLIYYNIDRRKMMNMLDYGKEPIDGVIIISPEVFDYRMFNMSKNNIPFVVIGSVFNGEEINSGFDIVDSDNRNLTFKIANHVINSGRKRILFINSNKNLTISCDRESGIKAALKINKQAMCKIVNINNFKETQKILNEIKFNYDVIITADDLIAKEVYEYCNKKNISIGNQVYIFALGGDIYTKDNLNPTLSFAYQNYFEISKKATKLLLDRINNKGKEREYIYENSIIKFKESCL